MPRIAAASFTRSSMICLGTLRSLRPNAMVCRTRSCAVQRVVLEHHRDVPVLRHDVVDQLAVDVQFALGNFFKARDHAQASSTYRSRKGRRRR